MKTHVRPVIKIKIKNIFTSHTKLTLRRVLAANLKAFDNVLKLTSLISTSNSCEVRHNKDLFCIKGGIVLNFKSSISN